MAAGATAYEANGAVQEGLQAYSLFHHKTLSIWTENNNKEKNKNSR
ncbi:MAG: hypothetical protein ACLRHW_18980 [Coprobacillus cateniformis]